MKPHERRRCNQYPYYKLARFDGISMTFRDGSKAFSCINEAKQSAKLVGKYRLSVVTEQSRKNVEDFIVQ